MKWKLGWSLAVITCLIEQSTRQDVLEMLWMLFSVSCDVNIIQDYWSLSLILEIVLQTLSSRVVNYVLRVSDSVCICDCINWDWRKVGNRIASDVMRVDWMSPWKVYWAQFSRNSKTQARLRRQARVQTRGNTLCGAMRKWSRDLAVYPDNQAGDNNSRRNG